MKNLSSFQSFIFSLNEAEEVSFPWDPKKAQGAIEKIMKKTGGSGKDKDPSGLSFNNIKQVFGKTDYSLRYVIAQALKIAGRDLFPTNSFNPDKKKNESEVLSNEKEGRKYSFHTYYIGEKSQNQILDKVSAEALEAIKPVVNLILKSIPNEEKYYALKSTSLPEVARAKINLSKIR